MICWHLQTTDFTNMKDFCLEWTTYQNAFKLLKKYPTESPILKYPNPEKTYTLFTDANKHAWACVLTQTYTYVIGDNEKIVLHPIIYVSGLFEGR